MSNGRGIIQGRTRINQPAPVSALWSCPSCGAENPGTVDDGCQNDACPTRRAPPSADLRWAQTRQPAAVPSHPLVNPPEEGEPPFRFEAAPEEAWLLPMFSRWLRARLPEHQSFSADLQALLWDVYRAGARANEPPQVTRMLLRALEVFAGGLKTLDPLVSWLIDSLRQREDDRAFEDQLVALLRSEE